MFRQFTLLAFAGTDAGTSVTGASDSGFRLLDYVRDGGVLSYVLIGLSVAALTSVFFNLWALRLSRQAPRPVISHLQRLFREGRFREAEEYCLQGTTDCFLARVVAAALNRCLGSPYEMAEFRTAVEATAPTEVDRLHRHNDALGIIAAVAPMLGLLGTVIGMIGAFRTIGTLTGAQRSNELATFMSMALVNTAEGLIVAIPCTVAFALFRRHIDEMIAKIGAELEQLAAIALLASGASNVSVASRTNAPTNPAAPQLAAGKT